MSKLKGKRIGLLAAVVLVVVLVGRLVFITNIKARPKIHWKTLSQLM